MKIWAGLGAAMLACASGGALAQADGAALAAKFGALEDVTHARVSPDGNKVAFISESAQGGTVYVVDMIAGGKQLRVMGLPRSAGRITNCSWTTNTRIVCRAYYVSLAPTTLAGVVGATRLYAVDADAKNLAEVTAPKTSRERGFYVHGGRIIDYGIAEEPGSVLMTRQFMADDEIGTRLGSTKSGLGVELVDTQTLKRNVVEQPNDDAFTYISDGHGTVRVMGTTRTNATGYMEGDDAFFFRKKGERKWEPLSVYRENRTGFNPVAVDSTRNVAYGFDNDGQFRSLFTMALDGTGTKTKLLGKPGYDVDTLLTIGRHGRVVGASYATERRETAYFDAELDKLSGALEKALPGGQAVDIVDSSEDEKKLLVVASSDTSPGQFYLYDKTRRALEELLRFVPISMA